MSIPCPQPGDLLVCPSGSFHGKIFAVNPISGASVTAFSGGELTNRNVWNMEVDEGGRLILAMPDKIVRIDVSSGAQETVSGRCDVFPGLPSYWADLAQVQGTLFAITDSPAGLVRIDEGTGEAAEVNFGLGPVDWAPTGIEPGPDGKAYVVNGADGSLIRFSVSADNYEVVADIGFQSDFVVAQDGAVYFTRSSNEVLRVDPATRAVPTIVSFNSLRSAFGIVLEPSGKLVVTDLASDTVVRVDPATGDIRTLVEAGSIPNPGSIVALAGPTK